MSSLSDLAKYAFELWTPPAVQTVSEWADAHRILVSDSSAEPGPWRTDRAPYQREIMDSFTQPGVWQIVIMSSSQVGKALAVDTFIPTIRGWRCMGEIQPGDYVLDETGAPTLVTAATRFQYGRPCFRLTFSDGSTLVADKNHKWLAQYRLEWQVLTTAQILADFTPYAYILPDKMVTPPRSIVSIEAVQSRAVKCITVDSESHLYLAGRSLIPTHNSEMELNMIGCAIDNDPGPMLYIQPTDKVAEDYSKRRIAPMIAACPTLRGKVFKAKGRDAANTITMKTFPGGSLAIIGANSPADLASKPVRYIFMDETDRFPASAGTEGDPQELAERRTETFRHNRKIVKTSTPTLKGHSRIEKDYMNGTQEEWRTECPYCHTYSFIKFSDIKFEKDVTKTDSGGKNYKIKSAVWRCPVCERDVGEYETKRLPAKWVAQNPAALDNGIRSFRMNAFMSPWSDWKDICLKYLKAYKDPEKLKVFCNTMLGESWEYHSNDGLEEKLYQRREQYDAEVPTGVLLLTCGIDTQDNRLEYEVVGWDRDEQSWGIARGVIPGRADGPAVWDEVDKLLDREWHLANGMKMKILATFIDSGGHHTQDVYRQCFKRQSRRIWPIKGEGGVGKPYCRLMKGNDAQVVRFIIGVDGGKEGIMYAAQVDEPGPKYMHFPIDFRAGYDREYFRGLISEHMVVNNRAGRSSISWEKIYNRNEPLDCRNYARAAYRYFNWHFDDLERTLKGDDKPAVITRAEAEKRKQRHVVSRGITI